MFISILLLICGILCLITCVLTLKKASNIFHKIMYLFPTAFRIAMAIVKFILLVK